MKKVLLTAMALLTIASASVFGMYGRGDSWIDFLVHGNQFRARMDQLGFVLGNGTIKGTVGFRAEGVNWGNILSGNTGNVKLDSTISAGIGYTSDMIGIGLGYNYTFATGPFGGNIGVHTPVLMVNALNNNLRISVPIQVAVKDYNNLFGANTKITYTGVAFNNIQLRYYTGIDAFNAIRLYFYYRNSTIKNDSTSGTSEIFGFQARFYFLNTQIGNVTVNPYLKVAYDTALKGGLDASGQYTYTAENVGSYEFVPNTGKQSDIYEKNPYKVTAQAVLGITANSDIVSLYVEPSLGYTATYDGKYANVGAVDPKVKHSLAWGAYTELYIRPVQDLEWYFEMDVNNGGTKQNSSIPVYFETTTGITWYLPAFDGAQ